MEMSQKFVDNVGNKIYWIIKKIVLIIWIFAFLAVSYGTYQEATKMHHVWIVTNILNGLLGGILLVYPFDLFRLGWDKMLHNLIGYIIWCLLLTMTSAVISGFIGMGGIYT